MRFPKKNPILKVGSFISLLLSSGIIFAGDCDYLNIKPNRENTCSKTIELHIAEVDGLYQKRNSSSQNRSDYGVLRLLSDGHHTIAFGVIKENNKKIDNPNPELRKRIRRNFNLAAVAILKETEQYEGNKDVKDCVCYFLRTLASSESEVKADGRLIFEKVKELKGKNLSTNTFNFELRKLLSESIHPEDSDDVTKLTESIDNLNLGISNKGCKPEGVLK